MPQRRNLIQRPPSSEGQLPTSGGVSNVGDDILRAIAVAFGIEGQAPGDAAGAIGASAGLLPMGKLLKFLGAKGPKPGMPPTNIGDKLLREHEVMLPHEFHQMPEAGTLNDLPREEIDKMLELTRRKPQLRKPGDPPNSR